MRTEVAGPVEGFTPWSHAVELPVKIGSASRARHFVVQQLATHDLSYLADDVRLVVSELATNAVKHAQTPFTVSLSAREGAVLLTVRDGAATEPTLMPQRSLELGGRGLRIVQALSRDWGSSVGADGGKAVWAVFDTR